VRTDCTKKPSLIPFDLRVCAWRRCLVNAPDRIIRWTTPGAVVGVAAVAAVASYEHAYDLVQAHGEAGCTARLVPLTVDGRVYAGSMVMLDPARRGMPVPALVRWLLGPGIAATLAANVAHGLGHGPVARRLQGGRRSRWSAATDGHPQFPGGNGWHALQRQYPGPAG
jgi:hypothetical protein